MRVVIVTNIFPPAIGGPATFGARLADSLANNGHKVAVVCSTRQIDKKKAGKYRVVSVGTCGNILKREIETRLRLLSFVVKAEVVYCMGLEHQTRWVCRLARKPFVLRIGGDSVWEAARNSGITGGSPEAFYLDKAPWEATDLALPYSRRQTQMRHAAAVVYVSRYMKRLAGLWGAPEPAKQGVILNGIEMPAVVATQRNPAAARDGIVRLLFVGRQTNWKGVDAVLLALSKIDSVRLTVAGSGPELPANMDLARRLELEDRVTFTGRIDQAEVARLMKEHDILVLPSLYEGLSNTLLEAGALGMCCIASNRGGNDEVIRHEQTGVLVDPFDIPQLANAIRTLAENAELRIRLGEANRRRVCEEFRLGESVEQTFELLRKVAHR